MTSPPSNKSATSIRQMLNQKPHYGRDDPRFWRERIDRWEKGKDRQNKIRRDTADRADSPLTLKPESFWQGPQSFWQGPQSFWQEPEPLKDALIAEIVRPLEAHLRNKLRDKLEDLWAVKQVRKQQDRVGRIQWFFDNLHRQFENKVIKFGDYLRILKAFYALLKLLDERRVKNQMKKEYEEQQWENKTTLSKDNGLTQLQTIPLSADYAIERKLVSAKIASLILEAKDEGGLADKFLQETGMGSLEEIELIPGLKLKVKDDSGGGDDGGSDVENDEGGGDTDSSSSSSDDKLGPDTKSKSNKPKTQKEEKSSRKWLALSAKLRAEATGLDKKEAREVLRHFGKAVATGDEAQARKVLTKAKNSNELWKWAKEIFFKKRSARKGAIMSDIKKMVKELDIIAASLQEAGAEDALIDKIDLQAEKLLAYYSMEEEDDYAMDEDVIDDSADLAMEYNSRDEDYDDEPPMGGLEDPSAKWDRMLENQQTTPVKPEYPMVEEDDEDILYNGSDDYDDDEIMEYESDTVFADVVTAVAAKIGERGDTELVAEVLSLLDD